jgi:uncharacterized phage-associated protein
MAYDARAVANYFLDRAAKEGRPLDPMGIQKLVYFAHGWNLAIFGSPLIQQRVEAWKYGPVIADLYEAFREFGRDPITKRAKKYDYDPILNKVVETTPTINETEETKDTRALLDRVWESNKHLTSIELSNLTHLPESPWSIARQEGKTEIDDSLIRKYIEDQARENAALVGKGT